MILKPISTRRDTSPRAERRHYIDTHLQVRQLDLLKEDLTETANDHYKRKHVGPLTSSSQENPKIFYNDELERKLMEIDRDLKSMNIKKVEAKEIDSILYVSSYQAGFNPQKVAKGNFTRSAPTAPTAPSETQKRNTPSKTSLYQESFHENNSVKNTAMNRIFNSDHHVYGRRNLLEHQATPNLKINQVMVLDPNKTFYKTSYEKDYSERIWIKEIPPEQIPVPSTFGAVKQKRIMKFRKWGGYSGP